MKMMSKQKHSRRQFLRTASMASMAGLTVSPFLLELNSVAAMAQQSGTSDYKALVCIFLQGGNDGHGTVIATDAESFASFTQARSGAPGLAYAQSSLLPVTLKTPQSGRTFALNPNLTGVQNLFNAGRAAIISNTGTLIAPVTKAQIQANSVPLPASLYSHFDQSAAWQAITATSGSAVHEGWGGAIADILGSQNAGAVSIRREHLPAQRHLGWAHSDLRVSQPHLRCFCRDLGAVLHPQRRRDQPLRQGVRSGRAAVYCRAGDARHLHAACRAYGRCQSAAVS
jgi:uncharacterized protein (DUF1501 family)